MISEERKPTLRNLVHKLIDKMQAPPGADFNLFKATIKSVWDLSYTSCRQVPWIYCVFLKPILKPIFKKIR